MKRWVLRGVPPTRSHSGAPPPAIVRRAPGTISNFDGAPDLSFKKTCVKFKVLKAAFTSGTACKTITILSREKTIAGKDGEGEILSDRRDKCAPGAGVS